MELEAISESSGKVDGICRFLGEEAVFQPGILSPYFIPTSINLSIALVALDLLSKLLSKQDSILSSTSEEVILSIEKHFQKSSIKFHCADCDMLVEIYSEMTLLIGKNASNLASYACKH
jgi:hypothetical protein